jgi:Arc/MetJ family transcription regulator
MTKETPQGRLEDLIVPMSAPLPKTVTDVDDALLAEAQLLLGLVAENDTVNLALAGLIAEQRRLEAVESELRRYRNGQFLPLQRHLGGPA